VRVLAVVVRYNTAVEDSETLQGLSAALAAHPDLAEGYHLLIWDNSPEPLPNPELPIPYTARHAERNLGVSGAYNHAMQYALQGGNPWMLLLDQDTTITAEFLRSMLHYGRKLESREDIAAVAPTVRTRGVVISPLKQLFNRNRPYPAGLSGVAPGEATAANSGCLMRVSALAAIGGFNTDFWLDYSDMYVFHQFFLRGKKVWLAADTELEHELSIMDYDRLMSPWRYRNFSYAETAFYDLYKGRLENIVQSARVFARAIKQRRKYKNPEFSRIAWEQFLYRLRVPRKQRVSRWRTEGKRRLGLSGAQI
jgi:GT2 family glycosyltransferase